MLEGPLVSILMNCYNGEKYLREALNSVLDQTYKNWELIFWDNHSNDQSANIFHSYNDKRLKYFLASSHTDLGGGRASAWKYLSGDFVAVLDADDVWFPTKLQKQIPLFDDPEVGIVICDTLFFNEVAQKPLYAGIYPPTGWVFERLMRHYFISLETLVVRKASVSKLTRAFDAEFSAIADFDLVVRLSRIAKLAMANEVLAKWRVHGESDTWRYPMSFFLEKEKWILKQVCEDPIFYNDRSALVQLFKNKNMQSKAILMLRQNHRIEALRILYQTKFNNWRVWVLFALCFFPFSNVVLDMFLKWRNRIT